jgi:hypothetical protein
MRPPNPQYGGGKPLGAGPGAVPGGVPAGAPRRHPDFAKAEAGYGAGAGARTLPARVARGVPTRAAAQPTAPLATAAACAAACCLAAPTLPATGTEPLMHFISRLLTRYTLLHLFW